MKILVYENIPLMTVAGLRELGHEVKEQTPPADEAIHASLRRRQLIQDSGDRWRLRVPLMARWLRQRG